MANQDATYKCNVCGNVVKVIKASYGTLVCCGQPMQEEGVESSGDKQE